MKLKRISEIGKNFRRDELTDDELQCLREIVSVAQVVVSSLELDEVLQNILCSAMGIIDVPAGSIALYDQDTGMLELHAHVGLSDALIARNRWRVKPGGLTHRILAEGELFIVEDCAEASFFNNPLALDEGIRSLIAVPLKIQEKFVGILYLDDFQPRKFPALRLHMLSILASFATMSIDNARLHIRTRQLACTDGLTGLYNHRQFLQVYGEETGRALRYSKPLALIMIDVDDFKAFNDRYGHPVGDRALIAVAEALRQNLRSCDTAFRYGGEEFIAILPETGIEAAVIAAERIRRAVIDSTAVALQPLAAAGVTISLGVASCPRDGSGEMLLKTVDEQLYRAKREGKNCIYFRAPEERH